MNNEYEVFISSVDKSLFEENSEVIEGVLECNCNPTGMEIFYVPDEFKIEFMKVDIDESDFVLLVLADKYGAENLYKNDNSIFVIKKELEYAFEIKKPIIALIHENLKNKFTELNENDKVGYQILEIFSKLIFNDAVLKIWNEKADLKAIIANEVRNIIKDAVAIECNRDNEDTKKEIGSYKYITLAPQEIEEVTILADYLKKEDSIIKLDLENLDVDNAQRIIDFVMGLVYMAEGSFQRMKEKIFIVAPNGYEFYDDFESLFD